MTKLIKGKKGMSPLLVTIFLAALAVSLGAMIMSWGTGTAEQRDSSTCDDVSISPQVMDGEEMICFDETEGGLKIVITNDGDIALGGIVNRYISSDFEVQDNIIPNSDLSRGNILSTTIRINPGKVRVNLIPMIEVLNEQVLCTSKAITRENIAKCD